MHQSCPIEMPKTYTIADVAQELGVAESTVRRWIREGRLRGKRRPALWEVPEAEVRRMKRHRKGSAGGSV